MTFNRYLVLFLCCAAILQADTLPFFDIADSSTAILERHGFENIRVQVNPDSHIVMHYENRLYRNELFAAGVVLALTQDLLPDSGKVRLFPNRRALAICELNVDVAAYREWVLDHREPLKQWVQVRDASKTLEGTQKRQRPGFGKIDLTLTPSFSVFLGNYDDRFKAFLQVMPVVSTSLWRGAAVYVESAIPLYNDVNYQFFRFKNEIQLSKAAVNQMLWLPGNVLGSVTFGVFNPNRWGIGAEVVKLFLDRHLAIGYNIEQTGFLLYYDGVWNYSRLNLTTSKLYALYYYDTLNMQFGISYNRYVMQDSGWLFEMSRNFHESRVGIFAGSTEFDKFGGLSLSFPLSRRKQPAPRVFRAVLPRYYEYSYRATNVVYTQHAPIQTGISVYTGTKLSYVYRNLTPNYVSNNPNVWRQAFEAVTGAEKDEEQIEYLLHDWFRK